AKLRFGERVAAMAIEKNPALSEDKRNKDRLRYTYAPIVVVVVARLQGNPKVPQQEQLLSAGCVAYNLLLCAQALGYGAQWITGWAAYDGDVAALLGLAEDERVVGFVHVGTPQGEMPERKRPALAEIVSAWNG
ncbi:MAG TPA: nitroreductase family protein, partial [Mizugakiibacter sp.]